jgi:Domain of unknown function (DUF4263)
MDKIEVMPRLFDSAIAERSQADRLASAALFQGSRYGEPFTTTREQWENFRAALESGNEEQIHLALFESPYLIQYVIDTSGHHGTWAFSKQTIKTQSANGVPGLIPDFLVATRNSLGYSWHIIELKRPDVQFANKNGDGYSTVGHKAIVQCAYYYAHFREYIETVRSNIGVEELIQPKSVVLVIGNAETETDCQRICRSNFHGITELVRVVTYDRIMRGVKNDHPQWFD